LCEHYSCDVLCLGGGGAAVTAAVKAANCGADVIVVSKEPLGYGDTRMSMGMLANPGIVKDDNAESFLQDLLSGGENISDPILARIMAENAHEARGILESYGHLFQRDSKGEISSEVAHFTGGHSRPRTISCPPSNGIGIGNALRAAAAKSGIKILEETSAYKLLIDGRRVAGAVCFDLVYGKVIIIIAKTVIIATGGAGWLYYPHTSCSAGATGDGYSLAYEIGAELTDMEQIQFVPFALTHPSSMSGICISDPSIAGPAGVLKNNKGQIVLDHINSMTRAEVARVMALQLKNNAGTEHGGLLLDLSPNLGLDIGRNLWDRRNKLGQLNMIRIAYGERAYRWEEPWDVAPTAHYTIGGIKVNALTQSAVSGLYAVGQAMGGIFGADRLGAVSLAELFVFGEIAGEAAAKQAHETEMPNVPEAILVARELSGLIGRKGRIPPLVLKRRLQKVMWEKVGMAREKKGLQEALAEIVSIGQEANEISISPIKAFNREVTHAIELKHMLQCAVIVVQSALTRQETRGAHLRLDYPERDNENWKCNIVIKQSEGKLVIKSEAVKLQ
jgi:succinate dehydrogenase/fumarate reductase flavoprotein subunit